MLGTTERTSCLTTIPAAPGPGQQEWRCGKCQNMLGVVYLSWVYIRHRRRYVVASLPAIIHCEGCGKKNWRGNE